MIKKLEICIPDDKMNPARIEEEVNKCLRDLRDNYFKLPDIWWCWPAVGHEYQEGDGERVVNGERFAPGYTRGAAIYEQGTRP